MTRRRARPGPDPGPLAGLAPGAVSGIEATPSQEFAAAASSRGGRLASAGFSPLFGGRSARLRGRRPAGRTRPRDPRPQPGNPCSRSFFHAPTPGRRPRIGRNARPGFRRLVGPERQVLDTRHACRKFARNLHAGPHTRSTLRCRGLRKTHAANPRSDTRCFHPPGSRTSRPLSLRLGRRYAGAACYARSCHPPGTCGPASLRSGRRYAEASCYARLTHPGRDTPLALLLTLPDGALARSSQAGPGLSGSRAAPTPGRLSRSVFGSASTPGC